MASNPPVKRVQDVVPAVVVSIDPNSQEQKLSVQAQSTQLQASTDSHYDTVLERYSDMHYSSSSISLGSVCIALSLLLVSYCIIKRR
jgi:ribosomal protein S1